MSKQQSEQEFPEQWLTTAVDAARAGGRVLQDWIGQFSVREKSRANLVTEADEASQEAIVRHLSERFPDHKFLGEENLVQQFGPGDSLWIIDPLDGTTNYVHGFPYYAVSVALYRAGRLQVGVIYDPTRGEIFTAMADGGAFLNGRRLTTSGETQPSRALAVASLPTAPDPAHPAVRRFLQALPQLQSVQRTGSAALNLAYVAAGRIDAFWSTSLHAWDIAAGVLLVQEAGGAVTDVAGAPIDIFGANLLAASSHHLQRELTGVLS